MCIRDSWWAKGCHASWRCTMTEDPRVAGTSDALNRTVRYTVWAVYARTGASVDRPAEAATELDAWAHRLAAEDVVLRGSYDVSGLRAEGDVMLWIHGP